jgi:hypothetical protein
MKELITSAFAGVFVIYSEACFTTALVTSVSICASMFTHTMATFIDIYKQQIKMIFPLSVSVLDPVKNLQCDSPVNTP